jgi:hypothetical protein
MVRIQEPDYRLVRALSAAIFKYLHISVLGSGSPELACDDDGAMVRVLMADESADESDHNIGGRSSGGGLNHGGVGCA